MSSKWKTTSTTTPIAIECHTLKPTKIKADSGKVQQQQQEQLHFPCNSFPRKSKNNASSRHSNILSPLKNVLSSAVSVPPNIRNHKLSTSASSTSTSASTYSSPNSRTSFKGKANGLKGTSTNSSASSSRNSSAASSDLNSLGLPANCNSRSSPINGHQGDPAAVSTAKSTSRECPMKPSSELKPPVLRRNGASGKWIVRSNRASVLRVQSQVLKNINNNNSNNLNCIRIKSTSSPAKHSESNKTCSPSSQMDEPLITSLGIDAISLLYPREVCQRYQIGLLIGDGNFATVHECVNRSSRLEYALKIIDKTKCKGREAMIENEVSILRRVRHTNIIRLLEEFNYTNELYLVTELVTGGDLFDAIAEEKSFSEKDASGLMYNLASALSYLHSINICHRDIKPENLLVYIEKDKRKALKVADFGLAVEVKPGKKLFTVCGTPTYVAPEILRETGYGLSVDVWAAGVIAYILLSGFAPFVSEENDQDELFDQILSGHCEFPTPFWDGISGSARELIACMLDADQNRRLTSVQVLEHPWVAKGTLPRRSSLAYSSSSSSSSSSSAAKRMSRNLEMVTTPLISAQCDQLNSTTISMGLNCSQEDIPLISSTRGSLIC
ncbi:Serine/threonine-protein kinase DCLK1 [Halotydeus destructor]|nr:Serine/threonine-protein kinase DCLK1 [Halotydeus destructor]